MRNGFALVAALVALALVEILAIGLIGITTRARTSAQERAAREAARVVAESAVRRAVADWDERLLGFPRPGTRFAVPMGSGAIPVGFAVDVQAERRSRGLVLVQATAWTAVGTGVRARAAATLSTVPADGARLDFHAAVVAGGNIELFGGAVIDGTAPAAAPAPLQPADCADSGPAPSVASGAPRPAVALAAGSTLAQSPSAIVVGSPPVLTGAARAGPGSFLRLSRLPMADIAAIADRLETGVITLGPHTTGGSCDSSAPGNWGAPASRAHACFDYVPLVFAPGGLTIAAGEGQALLVVDGDLTIADDVQLRGAILVTGTLDMGAAAVDGAIRVAGNGSRIGGSVRFDECALVRAFTLPPALRGVYRVADRWWLPAW